MFNRRCLNCGQRAVNRKSYTCTVCGTKHVKRRGFELASATVCGVMAPILFINLFAGWLAFAVVFGLMFLIMVLMDIFWPLKVKPDE
ncbi:hypothetical protein [Inquilinus limosus]|uniref:hypothetical protein n=1 Tax=Inquilinus limosus TaxID=171674 RepID=UPI0012DD6E0E|nr:hypothetical protein [Inquilinus limosus]